jgi:hypothetical protein
MHRIMSLFILPLIGVGVLCFVPASPAKEFLTDKEIEAIQDAQAIDLRVRIYMEAAELRLKTAEDRLTGKESSPGDPLEFFTPEDMVDAYYHILSGVMTSLDAAFQKAGRDRQKVTEALKSLKASTERAGKQLEVLKRLAEEKKKEDLWNLVNQAIGIARGAFEGAEEGLSRPVESPSQKSPKSR